MRHSTGLTTEQVAKLFEWTKEIIEKSSPPVPFPPMLGAFRSFVVALRYLRTNRVQVDIAEGMNVSQPTISRAITALTPILEQALLAIIPVAEDVDPRQSHILDGSLLPCWTWRNHPELYSGKHHTTGLNIQVACDLAGRIQWVSDPVDGRRHDTAALEASGLLQGLSPAINLGDKGYQGTGMITPRKKPINGELTDDDRAFNKQINQIRFVIERAIAHLKNWTILHTDYRRPLHTFAQTITVAIGLYFFSQSE